LIKGPFLFLAVLLAGTVVCQIFLPLAVLVGYPALVLIGLWYTTRWLAGRLERPSEIVAVWIAYLGLILTLQGILLCFDTALAGQSPTAEQKRFGTWLAYLGGAIAILAVILAYAIDLRLRRKSAHGKATKPTALDEWMN
jgi:hypothetical protein